MPQDIGVTRIQPPLFGLAPGGVYPAAPVARSAVRSCRTVSPLPSRLRAPAVCFLWHFPWGRPRRPLAGTVFPWSPDFPLFPARAGGSGRPAVWHMWFGGFVCRGQADETKSKRFFFKKNQKTLVTAVADVFATRARATLSTADAARQPAACRAPYLGKRKPSFSRKRSKKLLSRLSRTAERHASTTRAPRRQKFFGSFFQKRTACLACRTSASNRFTDARPVCLVLRPL